MSIKARLHYVDETRDDVRYKRETQDGGLDICTCSISLPEQCVERRCFTLSSLPPTPHPLGPATHNRSRRGSRNTHACVYVWERARDGLDELQYWEHGRNLWPCIGECVLVDAVKLDLRQFAVRRRRKRQGDFGCSILSGKFLMYMRILSDQILVSDYFRKTVTIAQS
jgi:hypothetical protein